MSSTLRKAAIKKEEGVTFDQAAIALRAYARQGFKNIYATSAGYQQAYITLRDTHARVTGVIMENYLTSLSTSVTTGSESVQEYWGVPKVNFATLTDMPAEVI